MEVSRQLYSGMAPPFTPELWNLVLEYLPIEKVVECKTVSSELGVAARFALTKGRWKPVAESVREFEKWKYNGVDGICPNPCYHAAWALDPVLLTAEKQRIPPPNFWGFLFLVEPSIDGLGRVIKSLDQPNFVYLDAVAMTFQAWVDRVTGHDGTVWSTSARRPVWTRLWRELERWSDGTRAGKLLASPPFFDWFEGEFSQDYALEMTDDWIDQDKRQALIDHIVETEPRFAAWEESEARAAAREEFDDY